MIPSSNPFGKALDRIQNDVLRIKVIQTLNKVPEGLWTKPASSSGKYHPAYGNGTGGLVRHTLAAIFFLDQTVGNYDTKTGLTTGTYPLTQEELDLCLAALILHDSVKYGPKDGSWTTKEHPIQVKPFYDFDSANSVDVELFGIIESHMGRWSTAWGGPAPKQRLEKIVHLCDYLASRKEIGVPEYVFNNS